MSDDTTSRAAPQQTGQVPPGALLRAARERAGWSAKRLALELGIPEARLHALEAEDHAGFGGVVFVRGYLRRAATLLGESPQDLLAAYEASTGAARPTDIMPGLPPGKPPRRGTPGWIAPLFGMATVAALVAATWWALGPAPRDIPAAGVSDRPESLALEFTPPEPPPAEADAIRAAEAQQAPGATPLRPVAQTAPETVAESLASGTSTPLQRADTAEPVEPPPGTVELRFDFTEDCWLEVNDAEDRQLAYRLYRAGEVARLRGVAPVSVFLGNAEGVRLSVDGAALALRPAARRDGTARLTVGGGAG